MFSVLTVVISHASVSDLHSLIVTYCLRQAVTVRTVIFSCKAVQTTTIHSPMYQCGNLCTLSLHAPPQLSFKRQNNIISLTSYLRALTSQIQIQNTCINTPVTVTVFLPFFFSTPVSHQLITACVLKPMFTLCQFLCLHLCFSSVPWFTVKQRAINVYHDTYSSSCS